MSWSKFVCAGCLVIAAVVACSNSEDFVPKESGGSDAGSDSASGPKEIGDECSAASECDSGFCADGFCCESACEGDCIACGVPGNEGVCTPLMGGTQGTCASGECGGVCDGKGACMYPGATTTCGASTCVDGKQSGQLCDGNGQCVTGTAECGNYVCFEGACPTSCATNTVCAIGFHCDTASGACIGKSANGGSCGVAADCESGQCVDGVCCDVACAAPASCSTGTCTCGDSVCGTGEACVTWYADTDNDGFGDPNATKPGCANTAPTGGKYVKNADDCYDDNISAKPGQTAFFATERGDGSFDYDCNGASEKQHANVTGLSCGKCGTKLGNICVACGGTFAGAPQYSMGFGCSLDNCSQSKPFQGFKADVACGATGTMYTCATNSCTTAQTQSTEQQACH